MEKTLRARKFIIDKLGRQVYGPYLQEPRPGKTRRRHVIVLYGSGRSAKRKNLSYARWLMEQHLGRELLPSETVDHRDEISLNDSIDNFQILSHAENCRKYAAARKSAL